MPPATASATVSRSSMSTRRPAATEAAMKAEVSGSTPTVRATGRTALRNPAMPAMSPPPPTGTRTTSTSGRASAISRPTVPAPKTMSQSL